MLLMKDKSENKYIAHVKRDDKEKWTTPHLLSSHLEGAANEAEAFASKFNCGKKDSSGCLMGS